MTTHIRNLSDVIVDYLTLFKIEVVFGIPGGHITSLYESLARSERHGGPRAITTRHESGAAFMAAGYAQETGKLGVCMATTGPGATNIITGVTSAYAQHLPLLVISGQTALPTSGQGAVQECFPYQGPFPDIVNTVAMLEQCTGYNTLVDHPQQLERKLAAALTFALRQPLRGPVHLAIPVDILRAAAPAPPAYPQLPQLLMKPTTMLDLIAVEELSHLITAVLDNGRKIILLIGHDCNQATDEILHFAEHTQSMIVTTQRGKAWIPPSHPLYGGVFGAFGHSSAKKILENKAVGLIIAVGTSLGQWPTGNWDSSLFNAKWVHLHPSTVYFARSPMAQLHVQGPVKLIFQTLLKYFKYDHSPIFKEKIEELSISKHIVLDAPHHSHNESQPLKPQRLMYELMTQLPQDTCFLADAGNSLAWAIHYLFPRQRNCFRLLSVGQPCTGWAPGGAIGTALGNRHQPVVCITGDGSFLMYGAELTVAVAEKLPIIFVILSDHSYGMIKFRNRHTGIENLDFPIPAVDFAQLAQAMGAKGYTIRDPKDFNQIDYQAMLNDSVPTVLDVYIDVEEVPPT